ncbi:MAG: hypothetical protein IKN24_00740 [Lachnospiraceae bacterium]|nr:hypothetical protein [Lachnospiraceae bacterium]
MKNRPGFQRSDLLIVLLDIIAINAAYLLALTLRAFVNSEFQEGMERFFENYYFIGPIYTAICILIFFLFRLYGGIWRYAGANDLRRIVLACMCAGFAHVIGTIAAGFRMPVSYYAGGAVFQFVFISVIRFSRRFLFVRKKKSVNGENVMIVGTGENGRVAITALGNGLSYNISCVIDPTGHLSGKLIDGAPVYSADEAAEAMDRHHIKCVFLTDIDTNPDVRDNMRFLCKKKGITWKDCSQFFAYSRNTEELKNNTSYPAASFSNDEEWVKEFQEQFGEEPTFF